MDCPMEGRIAVVEAEVKRVTKILEGNGQPGLVQSFTEFVSEWRGAESERERAAKRSNLAWNLRIAAIAVILAATELAMHGCKHF